MKTCRGGGVVVRLGNWMKTRRMPGKEYEGECVHKRFRETGWVRSRCWSFLSKKNSPGPIFTIFVTISTSQCPCRKRLLRWDSPPRSKSPSQTSGRIASCRLSPQSPSSMQNRASTSFDDCRMKDILSSHYSLCSALRGFFEPLRTNNSRANIFRRRNCFQERTNYAHTGSPAH